MTTVDLSRVYRAMLRKQQTLLATLGRTTPVHHGAAPLANLPDRTRGKKPSEKGPYRVPIPKDSAGSAPESRDGERRARPDPGPGNYKELWYQGGVALGCESSPQH